MKYKISATIERDKHGYYAYCPQLPGCQSQGDSFEEAMVNIRQAIRLYLSTLSPAQRRALSSREIVTTALEVKVA